MLKKAYKAGVEAGLTIEFKTIKNEFTDKHKNKNTRKNGIRQILIDTAGDGCIDAAYEIKDDGSLQLSMHSIGYTTVFHVNLYGLKDRSNEIPHTFQSEDDLVKFIPQFKSRIKFYPKMKHEYYGLGSAPGYDFNVESQRIAQENAMKAMPMSKEELEKRKKEIK
ncbi:MAG: hypothetical protein ACRC3J_05750 [Culicoidibacterales bacterium]